MTDKDFTIRILVKGGESAGLKIVEKSNWIGLALLFSRANYSDAKGREEFEQSGIYLLADSWTKGELPTIYIGEGENVRNRLDAHYKDKDKEFWNEGLVFTSKTNELNTAQIRYLEASLVELGFKYRRCKLKNRNKPKRPSLSEMDRVEVEGFLEEVLTLLPTFGVLAFQKPKTRSPSFESLHCKGKGYDATGWETPTGTFVVKKGSLARLKTTDTFPDTILEFRRELVNIEVLRDTGKAFEFKQDFEFSSPSYTATLVSGIRSNGRTAWKNSKGATLKQIQEEKVA